MPIRTLLVFLGVELVGSSLVLAGIIVEMAEHAPIGFILISGGSLVFGVASLVHAKMSRWFR